MLLRRWKGCILLLVYWISQASGGHVEHGDVLPARRVVLYDVDQQILSTLANTGVEVAVGIGNDRLPFIGEFQEEAVDWINEYVTPFLMETKITHIVAGRDVLTASPDVAGYLIPCVRALRDALAAADLRRPVDISTLISAAEFSSEWQPVPPELEQLLRILNETGSSLFIAQGNSSAVSGNALRAAARRALDGMGFPGVGIIVADDGELNAGIRAISWSNGSLPLRRELATGSLAGQFCVANPSADPNALQQGLNYACGAGGANCAAIQPNGPCYKPGNLVALASYAYNDYYHRMSANGASCNFSGTAMTTNIDPSSGACVYAGSSLAGAPGASAPTGAFAPPFGTPPFGSFNSSFVPPPTGALTPVNDGSTAASVNAATLLIAVALLHRVIGM